MRRLADGYVAYDYTSAERIQQLEPKQPVWVAPNALYPRKSIHAEPDSFQRNSIIYVGRLVKEKKVALLIDAFCQSELHESGQVLDIVGTGPELQILQEMVDKRDMRDAVRFHGEIYKTSDLDLLYRSAFAAVSPGYAGLSITQSIGFGVPILVPTGEPHAPEIELERSGGVRYFDGDSAQSLATSLRELQGAKIDRQGLSNFVSTLYSAEKMANGIVSALENLDTDGDLEPWRDLRR
ncbi:MULTISPECIES: glycosyltransferase [unclassified Nocardioides]|uniref:glycosyltransferase n=1 Tax=unclassified Nocardioides TaxID=2615069 RepID=UPI0009E6CF14|nr:MULTISPECIES: glycosyltransferase [unclassified Nocardioides]